MSIQNSLFSGIQPTGTIHIGNYFGALKNWVKLQDSYTCFYSVVDLHAITVVYDDKDLASTTLKTANLLLACGIDPEKSTLMVQSHIPFHSQLMWLLSCIAPYGDLTRMTQFKDKSLQHQHNINAGLFFYPILMASDILLYKTEHVPVGEDQLQHIELTREIARRFNERYNTEYFKLPQPILSSTKRLKGLDGSAKMSKSLNNYISLLDSPKEVEIKIKKAVTDPQRIHKTDKGNPFICNIFSLHQELTDTKMTQDIKDGCQSASLGCVDCKKILMRNLNAFLMPIQEKYNTYAQSPDHTAQILNEGAQKAKKVAEETLKEVQDIMGFLKIDYE
jgi:tryptophanyl-tRNA synthetase